MFNESMDKSNFFFMAEICTRTSTNSFFGEPTVVTEDIIGLDSDPVSGYAGWLTDMCFPVIAFMENDMDEEKEQVAVVNESTILDRNAYVGHRRTKVPVHAAASNNVCLLGRMWSAKQKFHAGIKQSTLPLWKFRWENESLVIDDIHHRAGDDSLIIQPCLTTKWSSIKVNFYPENRGAISICYIHASSAAAISAADDDLTAGSATEKVETAVPDRVHECSSYTVLWTYNAIPAQLPGVSVHAVTMTADGCFLAASLVLGDTVDYSLGAPSIIIWDLSPLVEQYERYCVSDYMSFLSYCNAKKISPFISSKCSVLHKAEEEEEEEEEEGEKEVGLTEEWDDCSDKGNGLSAVILRVFRSNDLSRCIRDFLFKVY